MEDAAQSLPQQSREPQQPHGPREPHGPSELAEGSRREPDAEAMTGDVRFATVDERDAAIVRLERTRFVVAELEGIRAEGRDLIVRKPEPGHKRQA